MWQAYLKEREGMDVLETEHGFLSYKITNDECYIKDIYVAEAHRKSGMASAMADKVAEVAKGKGCKWLTGSVSPPAEESHASLLVLIAYGMKLIKSDKDIVYLAKRID